jgi:hypothetical protein
MHLQNCCNTKNRRGLYRNRISNQHKHDKDKQKRTKQKYENQHTQKEEK